MVFMFLNTINIKVVKEVGKKYAERAVYYVVLATLPAAYWLPSGETGYSQMDPVSGRPG